MSSPWGFNSEKSSSLWSLPLVLVMNSMAYGSVCLLLINRNSHFKSILRLYFHTQFQINWVPWESFIALSFYTWLFVQANYLRLYSGFWAGGSPVFLLSFFSLPLRWKASTLWRSWEESIWGPSILGLGLPRWLGG